MSPWLKEFYNVTKAKYNSTSRSNILIKPNEDLKLAATTWREAVLKSNSWCLNKLNHVLTSSSDTNFKGKHVLRKLSNSNLAHLPSIWVISDACLGGGGGEILFKKREEWIQTSFYIRWNQEKFRPDDVAALELSTVAAALMWTCQHTEVKRQFIGVLSDSSSTVHTINKGRGKFLTMNKIIASLTKITDLDESLLLAAHVAGKENTTADWLSREDKGKMQQTGKVVKIDNPFLHLILYFLICNF